MNDIANHTTDPGMETTASDAPALVSLTEWAATTEQDDGPSSLAVLKLSAEPVYVSFFTDQGADYRSESLVLTCAQLGIRLMHTPAGHPDLKGVVERLFRRAKGNMFAGIPGSLFKNGERRINAMAPTQSAKTKTQK